jgi:galactan endo-1,6-beta-galactosidase
MEYNLPGLGLNIARYNIGGGGDGDPGEDPSPRVPWYRKIAGFWRVRENRDPATWDWGRDEAQRYMLEGAHNRGAEIEFFANAPMWWMTKEHSSDSGVLLPEYRRDFAYYLANVVEQSEKNWRVPVASLDPFNEPSARWWNYPGTQEGLHVAPETQAEILPYVREELNRRGLQRVKIAASDENTFQEATKTYNIFERRGVVDLVDQVNVHAYYGTSPNRDAEARKELRRTVGTKPLWMSEYGDNDGGGETLALTIMQDVNYLQPAAWVYWQPIEPSSAWGLINGRYETNEDRDSAERAEPKWVYYKYFAFAQFTRFIRPGDEIIGTDNDHAMCAYDAKKKRLSLVFLNDGPARDVTIGLGEFGHVARPVHVTTTNFDGPRLLDTREQRIQGKEAALAVDGHSVVTAVFDGIG